MVPIPYVPPPPLPISLPTTNTTVPSSQNNSTPTPYQEVVSLKPPSFAGDALEFYVTIVAGHLSQYVLPNFKESKDEGNTQIRLFHLRQVYLNSFVKLEGKTIKFSASSQNVGDYQIVLIL